MFIISTRIPEAEIRREVPGAIRKVQLWFKANPKRKTCNAQVWQNHTAKIHRDHVARDVKAAAFDVITENQAAGFHK